MANVESLVRWVFEAREGQSLAECLIGKFIDKVGMDFAQYPEDWKYVRDNGNRELVDWYARQLAEKRVNARGVAHDLMDSSDPTSLVSWAIQFTQRENSEEEAALRSDLINFLDQDFRNEVLEHMRLAVITEAMEKPFRIEAEKAFKNHATLLRGKKLFSTYCSFLERHYRNLLFLGDIDAQDSSEGFYARAVQVLECMIKELKQS